MTSMKHRNRLSFAAAIALAMAVASAPAASADPLRSSSVKRCADIKSRPDACDAVPAARPAWSWTQ